MSLKDDLLGGAISLAVKLVTTLLDRGEKPSLDDTARLAAALARDEATAIVMAQVLGTMARQAQSVRDAFDAKPNEVPILGIDVEIVQPE